MIPQFFFNQCSRGILLSKCFHIKYTFNFVEISASFPCKSIVVKELIVEHDFVAVSRLRCTLAFLRNEIERSVCSKALEQQISTYGVRKLFKQVFTH